MLETDVTLADGRTVHAYDTEVGELVVFWHHGTPNIGLPPAPLFEPGVRWVSYDRPGYGGSSASPGRDVASAAGDVAAVADALGLDQFVVMGHSGGGPHALACAAALPDRVRAAASVAGLAPVDAAGLDWFAGMGPNSAASLRAAMLGRAERERHEKRAGTDIDFIPADWTALDGRWSWFGEVVGPAVAHGPAAAIDDDLAYAAPWGFDPKAIAAPVLLVHGGRDLVVPSGHSEWLASRIPSAELRVFPDDGHISVLEKATDVVGWLREHGAGVTRARSQPGTGSATAVPTVGRHQGECGTLHG